MPIDTNTLPGQWFDRLARQLAERAVEYGYRERYATGEPDLPQAVHKTREAYQRLVRMSRLNYGEMIVDAVKDRMKVAGFRAADKADSDEMWRIWQANNLDADQTLIDAPTLGMGDSYAIVGQVDPDIDAPVISLEDPRQVITAHDPARRRKVVAALKMFVDEFAGEEVAYLYLPGYVLRATRKAPAEGVTEPSLSVAGFEWQSVQRTGIQQVPVVRFCYRPQSNPNLPGKSELHGLYDTMDRINHMLLQRVTIATAQAFKQRAAKGVPLTDAEGHAIDYAEIFAPDPGAMWLLPETAELWESGAVDLSPVLAATRQDAQDLMAMSHTPLYYLTPSDTATGSAEGASLAREGLIHKTLDRIAQAGESWEQVMALAFQFSRRPRPVGHEVIWTPPERFTPNEKAQAALAADAAGVPWRTRMTEYLQFSPAAVDRMAAERAEDQFQQALEATEDATVAS